MAKQILIAGASGFIGQYISKRFKEEGWTIKTIGRSDDLSWDDQEGIVAALDKSAVVINLAGKSVNCRHTEANKKEILESRVKTTTTMNECIRQCSKPPELWLNASGMSIYPRSIDQVCTEESDTDKEGIFMAEVSKQWEAALYQNDLPKTRRVALRTSVVLAKEGGSLAELKRLSKLGLGGTVGSGKQMMSWVHLEDYFQILLWIITHKEISAPVNVAAPNPVSNKHFMKALRKALGVPFGLPAPEFAVKIGAQVIGTEASLALDSYNVVSKVLEQTGYSFRFGTLEQAFVNFWPKK
ncbi:MAG: TIGR01777 family protein [Bacteroidetes bacterium 43-16]|nr:MAG: TIGR01777 family protein [Bacteroidetes bacterium 43-16]